MSSLLIHNGTLYTPFEIIDDSAAFVRDGLIEYAGARSGAPSDADETLDAGGRTICPGFIDLQVNGGGGALLTEDPTPESVDVMSRTYARFGTTAILPTIVTSRQDQMERGLAAVAAAMRRPPGGARILGSHLEGPFISEKRRGAHAERFLQMPSVESLRALLDSSDGTLRILTIAPELDGALDVIRAAREAGVVVSIGHSDATLGQAMAGIDAGATMATHLFNGMRPFGHRDPGIIGAVLTDDRVTAGVIPDGVHVDPAVLSLIARSKGPAHTTLVTDAMSVVGAESSTFEIYGQPAEVRDGACYLPDGTLAGSALTMDRAVWNMHDRAGVPLRDAIEMATATPAIVLGLDAEVGVLTAGARADITICEQDMRPWRVFVGGELVYGAG
jgi:N-acetylglucosamine-6-phosphate deacetylase